jgi:uncharacterized membrane protein
MDKKIMIIGVVAAVAFLSIGGYFALSMKGTSTSNTVPIKPATQTEVQIPVSDLSTTATFYSYDSSGVIVRYFAVKDSQGNVHVAFDACDVCYEAKKGYKQNGDVMQCLNCGKTFSITSIGTDNAAGGCWPSYLPMETNGTHIVIKISDLETKSYMF